MLNFGFISAVLLRYSNDIKIWRIVQFACFLVDIAYFWAVYEALSVQDRLNMKMWRAEDWGSVLVTGIATIFRMVFLTGMGLGSGGKRGGKKS